MKLNLKEWFKKAEKGKFAIPAFNYSDIWDLTAIWKAAEEERSPVIVSANQIVTEMFGVKVNAGLFRGIEEISKMPVMLHLDHCSKYELCEDAINKGYPSVMFDGSRLPFKENIDLTKRLVKTAHSKGVYIEGEIGIIPKAGASIEGVEGNSKEDKHTTVEEAKQFATETGVDSLAIAIGTAHGFYKIRPRINFQRLNEINRAIDTPLVLHGGTGIPDKDIRKAIASGINKVNVGTIIHCTYMNELKKELHRRDKNPYTLDVMAPVVEKIKEIVKDRIRVCGSNKKL